MKTFKLISLQIVDGTDLIDVELDDGLIINKEDEKNTWLLEAYTDKSYYEFFQKLADENKELLVQVVITKKENEPVAFETTVHSVRQLETKMSVLLQGTLKRTKKDYAELLLGTLLQSGLAGDELLHEFKEKMQNRPKIPASKKL
ncbi:hypothetical protein CVD25_00285 [Bacillus canaveralius]|uniref:YwpF-like family protein n=1 Tax=Bacillus canaveralius TaxID=1403243 RepID=A0A2N5GQD6_9BACI|nr:MULTISPECIES: YwpF-like family protein [Bacillus]PLR85083.1 hypothetical protein CU635_04700 [Bacillus canaveralius]PLR85439.1 hypothetical protein CVD23_08665 [Bacillus sp. V33-4]PLS00919.1 hypothetical protein CVD25_00285 [Bacillus canaveralius]RSK54215.1 hypothetical protein EJA13_06480 [Bacillus canaveralius]